MVDLKKVSAILGWSLGIIFLLILAFSVQHDIRKSTALLVLYLVLYFSFVLVFRYKKSRLFRVQKVLLSAVLFCFFPCLWEYDVASEQLGISNMLGSIIDLFSRSNFFFQYGNSTVFESLYNREPNILYQLFSLFLGFFVFLKIFTVGKLNKKLQAKTWSKKEFWMVAVIFAFLCLSYFVLMEPLAIPLESRAFAPYLFWFVFLYCLLYFVFFQQYTHVFQLKRNTFVHLFLTVVLIWFFPLVSISYGDSIQFTDSSEYNGHFPIFSTFGSSLFNLKNYFVNGIKTDPQNTHFALVTYTILEWVFVLILFIFIPKEPGDVR